MSQSISLYKQLANHKLFNKTINFNLKRIKLVLKKLNHPERKLNNVINFLGSSGKFSTLFSVKSFIEANNQSATAYISPSLKDIKERFWVGNRFLTHREIKNSIKNGPDELGYYGEGENARGGYAVGETLMPILLELQKAFEDAIKDKRDPRRYERENQRMQSRKAGNDQRSPAF